MKGYWIILKAGVSDQGAQDEYNRLWKPIAEKYQARINPPGVSPVLKEAPEAYQLIVVEFPSPDIARTCYDDPSYEEARQLALRAAHRELLIVNGQLE